MGSEWASATAEAAPRWPPAAAEAAPPPWMVAAQQQPQWPIAGPTAAPGAMCSMSGPTAGGFHSFAPARVPTKAEIPITTANRFLPLDDQGHEHRREVTLADCVMNPKKPRRRKGAPASMVSPQISSSKSTCASPISSCSSCPCTMAPLMSTKSGGDISAERFVGSADRH